ncbi:facilitated trehalose transporter Tret1-like isoform X2 [Linepithema humile]|uniref:facilitated trehalose transporter Tret1-like isoform X2 n=1 Tax=Linepithema humile TaxID=83485 RepID=UPI000623AC43|nr:PREDICTED: facilitated trehalose transporter Tret1-like isoform X2 [Linepithema humile]
MVLTNKTLILFNKLKELYVARVLCGLCTGMSYTTTPMYLGEISSANIRGYLVSMLVVVAGIGTLVEFIIGPFLSVQNLALVSLISPCLFVITFIWVPESPYHLIRCDARQKAINSLIQLRGKEDVYTEADNIEQAVKIDLANETGFREILFVPGNRRALLILLCLAAFQQLSGVSAILQFAEIIFDEANSSLKGKYLTMILGAVQLVSTIVCMFVIDRCGRKPLLIISAFGSGCSTAMVAIYFNLQYNHVNTNELVWLPITGVLTYMIMYSLGLAALVLTICSEVFPTNVKALGATLTVVALGVSGSVVGKLYLFIAENAGTHVPFWIFSACCFTCVLFTFFYVPETKGKTLEQIQEKLHKRSK